MNAKFLDKLDFYQKAYQTELAKAKQTRLQLEGLKQHLTSYIEDKITDWLGEEVDSEEKEIIQKTGIGLQSIFDEIKKTRNNLPTQIENIRNSDFYQKYLEMTIHYDFSIIFDLESDNTFDYLISKNFHNDRFDNRPKFTFPIFGTFQPRFKKFAKIAQVVAERHRFENYQKMFSTWQQMRGAFEEVVGQADILDAKQKFEALQLKIKRKNEELNNLVHKEMEMIVGQISEFIMNAKQTTLSVLQDEAIDYIQTQKEKIRLEDQNLILAQNTVNQIMKNMGFIQELSLNVHKVNANQSIQSKFHQILKVQDPEQDLFEILSQEEWQTALDAFRQYDQKHFKNANVLEDQASYSVTDLTPEQIQYLMQKYNVKEGEAFEPDAEDIQKLKLMNSN